MALTSSDIDNKSFSVDRKGYSIEEVDVFLEHVSSEVGILNDTIKKLKETKKDQDADSIVISKQEKAEYDNKLAEANGKIEQLKEELAKKTDESHAISEALIVAQHSANNIVESANKKGDKIVRNANEKSDEIINEANAQKARIEKEIENLKKQSRDCKDSYEKMLKEIVDTMNLHLEDLGNDKYKNPSVGKTGAIKKTHSHVGASKTGSIKKPAQSSPTQTNQTKPAEVKAEPSKDFSGFGDADFGGDSID